VHPTASELLRLIRQEEYRGEPATVLPGRRTRDEERLVATAAALAAGEPKRARGSLETMAAFYDELLADGAWGAQIRSRCKFALPRTLASVTRTLPERVGAALSDDQPLSFSA
jgi:hypothetical protein